MEIDNSKKVILHLCASEFGSDTRDYKAAGYDVRYITKEIGVENYHPPKNVYGIIANPPCTEFAVSGARWWKEKGNKPLETALKIVDECLRIIEEAKPKFWMLENPVGRLRALRKDKLGEPRLIFHPCDYGDTYTKKTLVWGNFNLPKKNPMKSVGKNKIHYAPPGEKRGDLRSIASPYFTKAFFLSNP